jgi:sugar fermentation stimulation protein A
VDPRYGQLLREAHQQGVEILAWRTSISPQAFVLEREIPVFFP